MPTPSVPSSSSYPQLSHTNQLPTPARSVSSTPISKAPTSKLSWGQKIQRLLGRRSTSESNFTQESLEHHNRRQDSLDRELQNRVQEISLREAFTAELERDFPKYSPYYIRGLTYPNPKALVPSSPGPAASQPSSAATRSSFSTILIKLKEWSSCSSRSVKDKLYDKRLKAQASYSTPVKSRRATPVTPNELSIHSETSNMVVTDREDIIGTVENKEKPLRERVLGAAAAAATPEKAEKVTDVKEYIWADKYQPQCLEDFICNRDKATQLQVLARGGGCGHFIFEGPPGVGKRTMIWAMLREAFGRDTIQAREEFKAFDLKGEVVGSIEVHVKQSPQHVEVNLSELKGYEKHVIVELMKETQPKMPNKSTLPCSLDNCRALILYEADKLSTDALLYIKWLLERYKGCNKVFFCCSDVAKLQAIKSICTVVELLPPSKNEIVEVLKFIAKQEGIDLPHQLAERFAESSKNSCRLAIRSFEATWKKGSYPFKEDQVILTGWEDEIADIGKKMIDEQSPKQLYIIRGKLQNLIVHGVSPEFIFKSLVAELKKYLDGNCQVRLEGMYGEFNRNDESMFESDKALTVSRHHEETGKRINDSSKKNIHKFMRIEEFIAKFMSTYKGYMSTKTYDTPT
ncbi:replication factor C subunit 3-like [Argentina anserina]|uniref:replication factor C subunit 3-like n=1 Tax=Argentina anserina TaxID=57926 RepID=UPI0021764FEF|nr:replication factor C subunit 3-like [Potentilla anserina]